MKAALKTPGNMMEDGSGLKKEAAEKIVAAVLARYPHLGDFGIGAQTLVGWNVGGLVSELKSAD